MKRRLVIAACAVALIGAWLSLHPFPTPQLRNSIPATTYANTYDSPQQFMEGIYAADRDIDPPNEFRIRALVVPHHLTATAAIAAGI